MEGVVAHRVPLGRHPLDQIGAGLDVIAHHEEGGLDVVLFQRVQDGRGVTILIPSVEG